MMTDERRLEAYLDILQARLGALPTAEADDIVREIRSHVRDSTGPKGGTAGDAVAAVLARLGPPEELAAGYVTAILLARAGSSRSPWPVLRGFLHWAMYSAAGILPLAGLVAGYVVAASLFIAALVKPFAPDRVGLWRLAGGEISLRLGLRGGPPSAGEEILGWWVTPLGLLAGAMAYYLTVHMARFFVHRFRRKNGSPSGGLAGEL